MKIENERQKNLTFLINLLGIKTKIYNIKYEVYKDNIKHLDKKIISVLENQNARKHDCTTRTICTLLDMDYYEVKRMQYELANKYDLFLPNNKIITECILKEYGYCKLDIGSREMHIAQFMYENKIGKYAICTGDHIFAYINGTWYDNKNNLNNPDSYLLAPVIYVYKHIK